jgi:hypothetical protein
MILLIIAIILFAINIVTDIAYCTTKNKYIKVMEQQNALLFETLHESNQIMGEIIKESTRKEGEPK